ncbi:MAG TPA: flagellar basal body rod protein FlgC [Burkholderiaceae bacterium]|nr:flagellar basal body rod protein FlgC [Burkholderiaceae bacterium]
MDYTTAFQISAAGMTLERARVDVTAMNLANMHASRAPDGSMYQPLRAVATSTSIASFGTVYDAAQGRSALTLPQDVHVEAMQVAPRMVHEPGHPHADDRGYVAYPGVNHAGEMVNLVSALRSYEANVVAMNAAKTMALKALDIGGGT